MAAPVYNLAKGKTLPEFIEESRRSQKALRFNEDYRKRMELLHDMQFQGSSSSVTISEDGNYIAASGAYPPEVRIFDLAELGMKCSRRLEHEIISAEFLSEDYRKMAMLCADRCIEFHAQYGKHQVVRIPKFGRSMKYDRATCILYVASSSESIYRVDLEEGVFLSPLVSSSAADDVYKPTLTSMSLAPLGLPVLLAGLDNGEIQSWDTRDDSKPISCLVASVDGNEVTQIAWSPDGMQIACGLNNGVVRGYDIRSSHVLFERDHRNDFPVVGLHYTSKSVIASADNCSVKIWNTSDTGSQSLIGFVESRDKINGLKFWPNSGLFFTPCEAPRVGTYFAPAVGPAPRWCSFLDTVADEINKTTSTEDTSAAKQMYDDYIFLTREQIQALGADNLIGTPVVKAYMHGFWMDRRVHAKLRDVAEPFLYEKYKQDKIKAEVEKTRPMRMPIRTKDTASRGAINERMQKELAEKMSQIDNKKENIIASRILEDNRFSKLWSNADFQVEEIRKTQEDDAFAQIGQSEVERIDLKVVNKIKKHAKPKI
jgi:ribosome biogenesis protein ENP2